MNFVSLGTHVVTTWKGKVFVSEKESGLASEEVMEFVNVEES